MFRSCIVFKAVVCRLYEMLYPCICNVVISCWESGAYGYVICRGGTDMCFVPGSGWEHLDLEQYRISGLTLSEPPVGTAVAAVTRQPGHRHRGIEPSYLGAPPPASSSTRASNRAQQAPETSPS